MTKHELQSFAVRYYTFEAVLVGNLLLLFLLWFEWDYFGVLVDLILAESILDLYGVLIVLDFSFLCLLDVLDAYLLIATFYLQLLLLLEQHTML